MSDAGLKKVALVVVPGTGAVFDISGGWARY